MQSLIIGLYRNISLKMEDYRTLLAQLTEHVSINRAIGH